MYTFQDQVANFIRQQKDLIDALGNNRFVLSGNALSIQGMSLVLQKDIIKDPECTLEIKIHSLIQSALIIFLPPGNQVFLKNGYDYYAEAKKMIPLLADANQKRIANVLMNVLHYFMDIHRDWGRDIRKIEINLRSGTLRNEMVFPLLRKYYDQGTELTKNYLLLIFRPWRSHENIEIKSIINDAFFNANYPLLRYFYIEYLDKLIDFYELCTQSNTAEDLGSFLKELSILEYNEIRSFIAFCKQIIEVNQIISDNFVDHPKKARIKHFSSQLEQSLEESNQQVQIAQLHARELLKEFQQQRSTKKNLFKKSLTPPAKPVNKTVRDRGNLNNFYEQPIKITPEDAAYELFEKKRFKEAVHAYEVLKEKKITYDNRIKQIGINSSIADCFKYWSKFESQKGNFRFASILEEKAFSIFTFAVEQIQIGFEESINESEREKDLLLWSNFLHDSIESLRPKDYLQEIKEEVVLQENNFLAKKKTHLMKKADPKKPNIISKTNDDNKISKTATEKTSEFSIKVNFPNNKIDNSQLIEKLKKLIPTSLQLIFNALQQKGYTPYLVGGVVRDAILGRPSNDIDVVSDAKHLLVADLARNLGLTAQIIGARKPIVRIIINQALNEYYDFATLEGEANVKNYSVLLDNGITVYTSLGTSLLQDSMHRDLSINSIYFNPYNNQIEDPTGNGLRDLNDRILRTNINPVQSFTLDPYRMLRIVRLKANLDFSIEKNAEEAFAQCSALLANHSPSRVLQGLYMLLINDNAQVSWRLLNEYSLLRFTGKKLNDPKLIFNILHKIQTEKIGKNHAWLLILAGIFWPEDIEKKVGANYQNLVEFIEEYIEKFKPFFMGNIKEKIRNIWLQTIVDKPLLLMALSVDEYSLVDHFKTATIQASSITEKKAAFFSEKHGSPQNQLSEKEWSKASTNF
ncbi:hypothetical protein ACD661_11675 [Legionella lytica]|uniref:Polynucleotide adenylyltransferase n=1 Tax=Legionella lytica TaxID=96232 RepID=A0ABW8DBL1_9GAMM